MKKLIVIYLLAIFLLMAGCSIEGHKDSNSTTVKKNECDHSFSVATCSSYATCSKCGEQRGVLLNHEYVSEVINPTCNDKGYTKHTCYYCGYSFNDNYTNTLAHTWGEWNTTVQPTCSSLGSKSRTCSLCSKTDSATIERKDHTIVTKKGYAATCTTKGLTDGKYCSVCNQVLTKQQDIAAQGHNYKSGKCSRCGQYDPDSYASTETKLLFIEYINQSINNQNDAMDCLTKYIKSFDDDYITYFYQFVELGYKSAKSAYDISVSHIDMQTVSDDLEDACDILYSILNESYNAIQLASMIEASIDNLSDAFYKVKTIMGY